VGKTRRSGIFRKTRGSFLRGGGDLRKGGSGYPSQPTERAGVESSGRKGPKRLGGEGRDDRGDGAFSVGSTVLNIKNAKPIQEGGRWGRV